MGAVSGLPVGLSFIGPRWSEAQLLAFGHVYEGASGKRVTPAFAASVEARPEIAPLLLPPQ
jgi:amidase